MVVPKVCEDGILENIIHYQSEHIMATYKTFGDDTVKHPTVSPCNTAKMSFWVWLCGAVG